MVHHMLPRVLRSPPAPPRALSHVIEGRARDRGARPSQAPTTHTDGPDVGERQRMKQRPKDLVIGYQRWDRILFVHWRVPAQAIRSLVHPRLSIDLYDGSAWISMTPFTLQNGRVRGLPPVPGVSTFHELNVRTYVHLDGREPGVWFFSLDATSLAATLLARASMDLPYYWCSAQRAELGSNAEGHYEYDLVRRRSGGEARFSARWGTSGPEQVPEPGSLDDFLLSRYRLYSTRGRGLLFTERIWHEDWHFCDARLDSVEQTLSSYDGLPELGEPVLGHFSSGANVEFYAPHPVIDR